MKAGKVSESEVFVNRIIINNLETKRLRFETEENDNHQTIEDKNLNVTTNQNYLTLKDSVIDYVRDEFDDNSDNLNDKTYSNDMIATNNDLLNPLETELKENLTNTHIDNINSDFRAMSLKTEDLEHSLLGSNKDDEEFKATSEILEFVDNYENYIHCNSCLLILAGQSKIIINLSLIR
jgi:hypothetical protein